MAEKEINHTLDIIKAIACIGVILLHCPFPGKLGMILYALSKFAVPFFLMISGYYCVTPCGEIASKEKIKDKILHILKLSIEAVVIYIVFHVSLYCIWGDSTLISEWNKIVSLKGLCLFVFVNSPMKYLHLWFLFSLIYCYMFVCILGRRFSKKGITIYISTASTIFIFISEFVPIIYDGISINVLQTQNLFLLRSLPFFLLGVLLKSLKTIVIGNNIILIITILGGVISVTERFVWGPNQFYIGTWPIVISVFIWGINNKNIIRSRILEYIGANLSLYIYVLHIAVKDVLLTIDEQLHISYLGWLMPLLTIGLSILFAYMFSSLKKYKSHEY